MQKTKRFLRLIWYIGYGILPSVVSAQASASGIAHKKGDWKFKNCICMFGTGNGGWVCFLLLIFWLLQQNQKLRSFYEDQRACSSSFLVVMA